MILQQILMHRLFMCQLQFIIEVYFLFFIFLIFNLDAYLLERIQWSNIDQVYRRNRERLKDLSFQKFCSESGFMRYFPGIEKIKLINLIILLKLLHGFTIVLKII